jgi:hypothetical protein
MHAGDRLLGVERPPIATGKLHVDMRVRPFRLGNRQAQQSIERDRALDILREHLDDCRGPVAQRWPDPTVRAQPSA